MSRFFRDMTAFLLLLLLLPESFLFLFPGIFILFSGNPALFDKDDPVRALASVVLVSFSFWIFSYWVTMFVPVALTRFFYIANALFIFWFVKTRLEQPVTESLPGSPAGDRGTWKDLLRDGKGILLCLLVLVLATRLVPFFDRITGSVGDMTQHNYMTRIILLNNGFTTSYEPVMPFGNFGEYPLGFHTLSAYLARLGSYAPYRATQFMSCVSYVLINLGLYLALSARFPKILSMIVSIIALYLSHYPQFLNQWGSAPTALSTAFLFAAYHFLDAGAGPAPFTFTEKIGVALVLAAGPLSHLVPPIGFVAYFLVHAAVNTARSRSYPKPFIRSSALTLILAFLFVLPFLLNFDFGVFARSKGALVQGHQDSLAKVFDLVKTGGPEVFKQLTGSVLAFAFLFGPVFSLLLLSCALGLLPTRTNRWILADFACALAAFLVLLFFFRYKVTPFYHLFQTERIHYFLLIPAAAVIARALELLPRERIRVLLASSTALFALAAWNFTYQIKNGFESHYTTFKNGGNYARLLVQDFGLGSYLAYAFDKVNSRVTREDIDALAWIRENVKDDSVFLANYGDGGGLIPAISGRKIWNPHGMDIWHASELAEWRLKNRPTHIYTGKTNNPAFPRPYVREELLQKKRDYKLLYNAGGCSVFKIMD